MPFKDSAELLGTAFAG